MMTPVRWLHVCSLSSLHLLIAHKCASVLSLSLSPSLPLPLSLSLSLSPSLSLSLSLSLRPETTSPSSKATSLSSPRFLSFRSHTCESVHLEQRWAWGIHARCGGEASSILTRWELLYVPHGIKWCNIFLRLVIINFTVVRNNKKQQNVYHLFICLCFSNKMLLNPNTSGGLNLENVKCF